MVVGNRILDIPRSAIVSEEPQEQSLMWEGLLHGLTDEQVDDLLKRRRSTAGQSFQPRSLASAVKTLPQADWVLVSVPGRYAAGVAREALEADKHLFLYSDNVSLEDEIALKETAREKGLLLMGPDCGTAIINGVPLAFAFLAITATLLIGRKLSRIPG